MQSSKKRILVAPLSWGLGHATRCIPIIKALINQDFEPIIASDSQSLDLLQKEFPELKTIRLPSYNIRYSKNVKLGLLLQMPSILKAIKKEHKATQKIVDDYNIFGIVSDNRYGVYSSKVPSVMITHQLRVFSGLTTKLSTFFQQKLLKKFDECWVPDVEIEPTLSGLLSHNIKTKFNKKYIGCLSRFNPQKAAITNDVLVLISGPEPQRSLLESKMFKVFERSTKKVVIVCGKIEEKQKIIKKNNCTIYNFALSNELENLITQSDIIVARSGYSTIMDLAKIKKKKVPTATLR